ncbi:MAG: putative zinc-binding protein [Candidatus Helarchaeota archaeon]
MKNKEKIIIVSCDGIGKVSGSIGREATYIITNDLLPNNTILGCLPLIMRDDEQELISLKDHKCIVLDGCPVKCAENNVSIAGGNIIFKIMVDAFIDKNSDIEAEESIIPIGKNAKKLAYLLAKEITEKIKNYFKTSKYNKINK